MKFEGKNCNMSLRKRGGGVKGLLELFQKIIRFGVAARPLCTNLPIMRECTKTIYFYLINLFIVILHITLLSFT